MLHESGVHERTAVTVAEEAELDAAAQGRLGMQSDLQEKSKAEMNEEIGWEAAKHESWDYDKLGNDEPGVKQEDRGNVDMRKPEVSRRARGGPASRNHSEQEERKKIKQEEREDDGDMRKEVARMARGGPASRNAGEPKVKQEPRADCVDTYKEVARRGKGGPASRRRR